MADGLTVDIEGEGKGFQRFLLAKIDLATEALKLSVLDLYQKDIKPQLLRHFESDRATGALEAAVNYSMLTSLREIKSQGRGRAVVLSGERAKRLLLVAGIGNVSILETVAPHWKYLEYGTHDAGAGEWPTGKPYRPGESPAPDAIDPEPKDSEVKGVSPNRAWRAARHRIPAVMQYHMGHSAGFRHKKWGRKIRRIR